MKSRRLVHFAAALAAVTLLLFAGGAVPVDAGRSASPFAGRYHDFGGYGWQPSNGEIQVGANGKITGKTTFHFAGAEWGSTHVRTYRGRVADVLALTRRRAHGDADRATVERATRWLDAPIEGQDDGHLMAATSERSRQGIDHVGQAARLGERLALRGDHDDAHARHRSGWASGRIYDITGSYEAAFLNGIAWNLLNGAITVYLLWRLGRPRRSLERPRPPEGAPSPAVA